MVSRQSAKRYRPPTLDFSAVAIVWSASTFRM
jgi:hypothetical protein